MRELFWSEDKARVAIFDNVGVRALLGIDALGKVTMCTLLRSSRVAWADRKICEGLRTRAKFYPAHFASWPWPRRAGYEFLPDSIAPG